MTNDSSVSFSGLSSSDPANPPLGATGLTYAWNFGDGGQANGPAPVHCCAQHARHCKRITTCIEYNESRALTLVLTPVNAVYTDNPQQHYCVTSTCML